MSDFYKQFKGLDNQIDALRKERNELNKKEISLEQRLETKNFIKQVLRGLKSTPKQEDPGKDDSAFYFVKNIIDDDLVKSGKPSLYRPCPDCKKKQPVLMEYAQTYNSAHRDVWEKEAFMICCDKKQKLAHYSKKHRF